MLPRSSESKWDRLSLLAFLLYFLVCVTEEGDVAGMRQKRCASCEMSTFEDFKMLRQQQILNELLKKLQLQSKPNVTVNYDNLPLIGRNNPRIKALIDQTLRENGHRRVRKSALRTHPENSGREPADIFPSLYESNPEIPPEAVYIEGKPAPSWFDQEGQVAFVTFSPTLRNKFVSKAILNIFLRPPTQPQFYRSPIQVEIYQRFENGTLGAKIATKHDHTFAGRNVQVRIPIDPIDMQGWIEPEGMGKFDTPTVGLFAQVVEDGENLVIFPDESDNSGETTFLELETFDFRSGRNRRNSQNLCRVEANQTGCCLYDLVIDFEKVGWEFVIAPKRYNAYICNGECDPVQMSKSPLGRIAMHAHVDHFLCCHPKEYTGITIVYVDESNQIWVREVPNMVAKKCGCT